MQNKVVVSKQGSLSWKDVLIGAGLSALTSVLSVVVSSLEANSLDFNWKAIAITAISTILAYLIKNGLLEPSKIVTTVKKADALEIAKDIKKVV